MKESVGRPGWELERVGMDGESGGIFDLSKYVGEQKDLFEEQPGILAMVKSKFDAWYKETMVEAEPRGPFKDF